MGKLAVDANRDADKNPRRQVFQHSRASTEGATNRGENMKLDDDDDVDGAAEEKLQWRDRDNICKALHRAHDDQTQRDHAEDGGLLHHAQAH